MLAKDQIADQPFADALERYLGATLHVSIAISRFGGATRLPAFLERTYKFYEARIAGRPCVFLAAAEDIATPADIAKHVGLVRSAADAIVVFAAPSLSAHNRSRLVEKGIPFVVPGNQLYIPELAMDLREYFRAPRAGHTDGLSPAAQAVLFHHLLQIDKSATTPSLIAEQLRYSAMTIGRAFDDLVATGLAETEKQGKERHIHFKADGRRLFDTARGLLRSPVRALKFVRNGRIEPSLKQGGETALAELTDLSPPRIDTYAVAANDWKRIVRTCAFIETDRHDAKYIMETWSYDPAGLSNTQTVDPLSLYAQFHGHSDERTSMAAARLLEKITW